MDKIRDYSEYVPYDQYEYMERSFGPLWWLPPKDAAIDHQPTTTDVVVVRAMNYDELSQLMAGKVLKNKAAWQKRGLMSTSVGFCFFKEGSDLEDQFIDENHRIFVYLKFRKGRLIRSFGFYGDPEPEHEHCTTQYSLADCVILSAYDTHCVKKDEVWEIPESWERLV